MTRNDAYVAVFAACLPIAYAKQAEDIARGENAVELDIYAGTIANEMFARLEDELPDRGWKDGPAWERPGYDVVQKS